MSTASHDRIVAVLVSLLFFSIGAWQTIKFKSLVEQATVKRGTVPDWYYALCEALLSTEENNVAIRVTIIARSTVAFFSAAFLVWVFFSIR